MAEEKQNADFVALKHMTKTTATFIIADREFTMKPLVISKVRDLISLMESSGSELQEFKNMKDVSKFLIDKIVALFPILFNQEIDQKFADDNISLPLCREILDTLTKINRMEDIIPFFVEKMKGKVIVKIREDEIAKTN